MSFLQRIQRNPVLLLGLGVVLIVAAVALIWTNLSGRGDRAAIQTAERPAGQDGLDRETAISILVAARDIPRGQTISAEDVTARRMAGPAPAGSFSDAGPLAGRVATDDIQTSQIVLDRNLSADPASAGIAALVPAGQRAFAIRVAEEDIVGGFLQAGDRVDVFATFPGAVYGQQGGGIGPREGDRSRSSLLLQDMQVLAVGPLLSNKGTDVNSGARTVTVAAAPDALARLALAGRLGHITLAIRNPSDRELAPAETVALDDLGPGTMPASAVDDEKEAGRSAGHRITVYSGASQSTVTTPR